MTEKKVGANGQKTTKAPQPAKAAAEKKPAGTVKASVTLEQLQREIAARAHQIYVERLAEGRSGDDLSDWLAAEAEIKKKHKLK